MNESAGRKARTPDSSALILTAAGDGTRFVDGLRPGEATKALYLLGGKPVFLHALEGLLDIPALQHVVITVPADRQACFEHAYETFASSSSISPLSHGKLSVSFISGGRTRQESVSFALHALTQRKELPEWVWIHDAARCCIHKELVGDLAQARSKAEALTLGIPSADAVKTIDEAGVVKASLPRKNLILVQTPQVFRFARIVQAHHHAVKQSKFDYADDAEMLEGKCTIMLVPGSRQNGKLTHPDDAPIVESILRKQGRIL